MHLDHYSIKYETLLINMKYSIVNDQESSIFNRSPLSHTYEEIIFFNRSPLRHLATHHARFWADDSFHSNLSFKVDLISIASSRRESHQPYVVFQKLKTSFHRNLHQSTPRKIRVSYVFVTLSLLKWSSPHSKSAFQKNKFDFSGIR